MEKETIRMKTGFRTVKYGLLKSNCVYELYKEDADGLVRNSRAEFVRTVASKTAEQLNEEDVTKSRKTLKRQKKQKELLVKTNLKSKEVRESLIKESNKSFDSFIDKAKTEKELETDRKAKKRGKRPKIEVI